MSVLNTSIFSSCVQRKLGIGFHNVGTGVLVEARTTDIQTHLDYLSQLFGKKIKAITAAELQHEQQRLPGQPALIVPYINVPEAEKRIEGQLGAESWGMAADMVGLLKNKADFYQLLDELNLDGFQ